MTLPNLDDLLAEGVSGRFVLARSDFNVPLDDGRITDPTSTKPKPTSAQA
jgi:phosphoglycerate kinase